MSVKCVRALPRGVSRVCFLLVVERIVEWLSACRHREHAASVESDGCYVVALVIAVRAATHTNTLARSITLPTRRKHLVQCLSTDTPHTLDRFYNWEGQDLVSVLGADSSLLAGNALSGKSEAEVSTPLLPNSTP